MQKDALSAFYPPQHFFVLVRGVVVESVPPIRFTNHCTRRYVQCREQRSRPMTLVVVGHRTAASLLDRQARLRPVQSLHRALFVDAEHHCVLRSAPSCAAADVGTRVTAAIKAKDASTQGETRLEVTDREGRYRIDDLLPGAYAVWFTLPLFQWVVGDCDVDVGVVDVGAGRVTTADAEMAIPWSPTNTWLLLRTFYVSRVRRCGSSAKGEGLVRPFRAWGRGTDADARASDTPRRR